MIFYKLERAEHFYAILAFQNALKSFRRVGLIKKGKNGLVTYPISWQKTTFGALLVGLIIWVENRSLQTLKGVKQLKMIVKRQEHNV